MDFSNISGDVVGMAMPNGTVKVVRGPSAQVGRVFESADAFYSEYRALNEGATGATCTIIESING